MDFLSTFSNFDVTSIIGAVFLFVFKDELTNWVKSWVFYIFKSGEYNIDGNRGTYDWCESYNGGKGEWFLRKILSYSPPFPLGINAVRTEVLDEHGEEHGQDIPSLDWLSKKGARRKVSAEQAARIKDAGNDWPEVPKVIKQQAPPILINLSADNKYMEVSEKIAEQLRNAATSLNSVGSRVSNLNKSISRKKKS